MAEIQLSAIRKPYRPIVQAGLAFVLFFATIFFVVLFGNAADHISWIAAFDASVYQAINLGPHPGWLDTIVAPFNFNFLPWGGTFIPSFIYFVFLAGFIVILWKNRKETGWAVLGVILSLAAAYVLFKVTNGYVTRDRPFLHLPNSLSESSKNIWKNWPTYPSGHVRDLALYSTVLAHFARSLRWPFIILTAWVAYTRIYLGAHYPTDVLAGWIMGALVGISILMLIDAIREMLRRRAAPKLTPDVVV